MTFIYLIKITFNAWSIGQITFSLRINSETVRLRRSTTTTVDLALDTGNIDTPTEQNKESEENIEASASVKLIMVMVVFLLCWLPFFLWLPVVHLLVSLDDYAITLNCER